jgi:tetratricopeptide (TPR) repeat protein
LHLEQFAEALAVLEPALPASDTEAHPEQAALWREAARAALGCHETAKAQTYLDQALAVTPADAEARYLLGQALARQGHGTDALAAFQHAARLAPGEGRYHAAWAEQLAHHGSLTEALPLIDQALATSADQPEVQRLAGELYLQAGRANDAIHILAQLTAARPHDPAAHLELIRALVTWADGQWSEVQAGLSATDTADVGTQMFTVIQKAAALGAEANTVRYWLGRAKAVAGDPTEAVALLEALPEADPAWPVAEAKRALGVALRRAGQCDKALTVLQASLPVAADPAPMYVEIGLTLQALNDMQGALAAFKRATSGASPSALAVRHLAEALWQTGAQAEAVNALSHAITLQPQAGAWHYRLGQMCQDQGEPDKALAHYQQAAQLAPSQPEYAAALAHALNHNGDHTAALAYFQRALRVRPNDAELWTALGQAYLALDDWRHAAHSFARAILLTPTQVAALLGSARAALALGDLHDAFNKAEAATRLAPNTAEVWVCFAEVWAARGDATQAEALYAQAHTVAVAQGHNPAALLLALGQLYLSTAQYPKAILAAERAIEHQADADEAYALLGEAHQALGQWDAALIAFREAQRLAPRVPRYWLHLGQVCRAQGQLDQALTCLTQARDLTPEDEQILAEIGLVFEQRKQLDRALEMYQQATRLAPRSAFHQTRLGVVLKQLKDYPGAVAALEQAVALDPKNLEATKQLAVVSALNLMHGERHDERREAQGAR